jgi:hypothetical protein
VSCFVIRLIEVENLQDMLEKLFQAIGSFHAFVPSTQLVRSMQLSKPYQARFLV